MGHYVQTVSCRTDPRDFMEISTGFGEVCISVVCDNDGFKGEAWITIRSEDIETIKAALDAAWIVALANERGE
jgi:hypothetical protein